jgi:hypothetical protein
LNIIEAPTGFIIQGLDEINNSNDDSKNQEIQDHIMQEPDEYVVPEIKEQ